MGLFQINDGTSLLLSMLTFSSIIYYKQKSYDDLTSKSNWNFMYDYIVIGAGSAGSAIAGRLSEDLDATVLLIEAGSSETIVSNTPAMTETLLGSLLDWRFLTTAQNSSCSAFYGNQMVLSSGRALGGSSSINRMQYLRGNPLDFDNWKQFGVQGWDWRSVLTYFIRSENQTNRELARTKFYGVNGPVSISSLQEDNPLLSRWVFASKTMGYHQKKSLNEMSSSGTSIMQTFTLNGQRISSSTSYLEPSKDRKNLHILANTFVTKILFERNNAIGVSFIKNWISHNVYASKEIILSAGAINSPVLLLLSGIGPKEHLKEVGIPMIVNLPVGKNFHDHLTTLGIHFTTNFTIPEPLTYLSVKKYFDSGRGPLSQAEHAVTMFQSSIAGSDVDWPDAALDMTLLSPINDWNNEISSQQRIGIRKNFWEKFFLNFANKPHFTIFPVVFRTKSRGTIKLNTANPMDQPIINPNYLDHPEDLKVMVEAMKEIYRIAMSPAMEKYDIQPEQVLVPDCQHLINNSVINENYTGTFKSKEIYAAVSSDLYLECVARTLTMFTGNYAGSCSMGSDKSTSVVDSKLRVHGIHKLRVADASVIPQAPSGYLHSTAVMIGERAAQFIKEDHNFFLGNKNILEFLLLN